MPVHLGLSTASVRVSESDTLIGFGRFPGGVLLEGSRENRLVLVFPFSELEVVERAEGNHLGTPGGAGSLRAAATIPK